MRTWALELEFAEMDKLRRKKAQVKGLDFYPLIKAAGILRLPTCPLKSFPKHHD